MDEYPTEVTDALGTDKETSHERLIKMCIEPYTDTAGETHTYAEWAALFANDADIEE